MENDGRGTREGLSWQSPPCVDGIRAARIFSTEGKGPVSPQRCKVDKRGSLDTRPSIHRDERSVLVKCEIQRWMWSTGGQTNARNVCVSANVLHSLSVVREARQRGQTGADEIRMRRPERRRISRRLCSAHCVYSVVVLRGSRAGGSSTQSSTRRGHERTATVVMVV